MIKESINKTRYKFLLNDLLQKSNNYIKIKVFYKNGLIFKIYPVENTLLNKHLLKL